MSLQVVTTRSHCKKSLQEVTARSHYMKSLQEVTERSHCKKSPQQVVATSHCKKLLREVTAGSQCKKMNIYKEFFMTPAAEHEVDSLEGDEVNLHDHMKTCEKNPDHQEFIPINDFTINHLPQGHRNTGLLDLIKATADLTVRVSVTLISPDRPLTWPGTKDPFPFSDSRGAESTATGSGRVYSVKKFTERDVKVWGACTCHKCVNSDTPSAVWGEVLVYTATHVVFDGIEGAHTSCRLFFDSSDSPLVALDGWSVIDDVNTKYDRCELKHVTCDLVLLRKLGQMWKKWEGLWWKVSRDYKKRGQGEKFSFIVSHPHGCPKHVSMGHWIDRHQIRNWVTKYTYTTSTCKGSSGAFVYIMGCESWLCAHVHSGVNSQKENFSAFGWG